MDYITGVFTKRLNPISLAIRAATPVSLTTLAPASHVIALDGHSGMALEANMLHGCRRVSEREATDGAIIVAIRHFQVPDAEAGLRFMREHALRGTKYDWKGAFGLGLAPGRNWQDPESFFCFEFFAGGLLHAGRPTFVKHSHITAHMLLSLPDEMPRLIA